MNTDRYRKLRAMEQNTGSTPNEKQTARKLREGMERDFPGIAQQADWEEREERGDELPGPYDGSGAFGGIGGELFRAAQMQGGWAARVGSFVKGAIHEVNAGLSVSRLVEESVDIEIDGQGSLVKVTVEFPIEAAWAASEMSGGRVEEYARLIGNRIGAELAEAFRQSGY